MFFGDYSFFDYKFNITGYTGQDYGGFAQYLYLTISVILLVILLRVLKDTPQAKVNRLVGFLGIFLIGFYIAKTTWESYYDVTLQGAFNTYLLPFDTCSIIMPAAVLAGFGKGRIRKMAASWCMTGGILGGFATMLFLNAFKYYPFFSFGAFYSMTWHFLMVFIGLLLTVTDHARPSFSTVRDGFLLHVLISLVVIPIDFLFGFDFMLYRELGGVPFFENVAAEFTARNLSFLNPPMMLFLYLLGFSLIFGITALLKTLLFPHERNAVPEKASFSR